MEKIKRAALVTSIYNKDELLPNVLYSLNRQKTTFPIEYCFIDDCSDEDPLPIIQEFMENYRYKRLNFRAGFDSVLSNIWNIVPEEADMLIMMSADVVVVEDDALERLCQCVKDGVFSLGFVANVTAPRDMYKDFNTLSEQIITHEWFEHNPEMRSGIAVPTRHYFFLGAMTMADAKRIDIQTPWCDIILRTRMQEAGLNPAFPPRVTGMHQRHPATWLKCSQMDTCTEPKCKLRDHFSGK